MVYEYVASFVLVIFTNRSLSQYIQCTKFYTTLQLSIYNGVSPLIRTT